jgi:hypothetical protein
MTSAKAKDSHLSCPAFGSNLKEKVAVLSPESGSVRVINLDSRGEPP